MRTIKFRAWEKQQGWLLYGAPIQNFNGITDDNWRRFDEGVVHWMQYTGLLDKNGKEIYEGDIVSVVRDEKQKMANTPHHEGLNYGDIADVRWNEVNLRWSLFPRGDYEETDMDYYGAWSDWNWLEIIGTIYENPELMVE